ncbi:uncharacterized protein LOC114767150 [Denticeps clupeoides]|uniref:Si:ch73-186j5.2 n=1 Tax=Denticeps clupeoides TaxID=299321 RepID=A0AAY4ERG7_9TELE|nr:uncharacterized protein LOC114767150 [Denticeps clupeoides]
MASGMCGSILVTGSNRGIGLELVRQMAESPSPPSQIFAGCRNPDGPNAKDLKELAQRHQKLITIVCLDTSSESSVREAAKQVGSRLNNGALNLLINNAGINVPGTLSESGQKEMVDVFVTNTVGPMLVSKEFLPYLKKAAAQLGSQEMSCRKSAVINISTLLSSIEKCHTNFAFAPMYPYRVSKAAVNMLTRCLAEDLKSDGILVTAIHPGWVQTDMGGSQAPLPAEDSVKGMLKVFANLTEKDAGNLLDWEGNPIPW